MARVVLIADREVAQTAADALKRAGLEADLVVPDDGLDPETAEAVASYRETLQRRAVTGLLAAGAAHDIANVVTALEALVMRRPSQGSGEIRTALGRIRGIVRGLTKFAMPSTDVEVYDLSELADEAIVLVSASLGPDVEFQRRYERNVRADGRPDQIAQLMVNLLLNAGEAVADQTVGRVSVSTSIEGNHVILRVSDNGRGIDRARIQAAFEPFVTTRANGSGLGLYVSRHIARAHGGTIRIDSTADTGTTVTVTLPRQGVRAHPR